MRTAVYLAALLGALQIAPAPRASAQAPVDPAADLPGPVAYTGHGALLDAEGNEITPTLAQILQTQRSYIDHLLDQAPGPELGSAFAQKRSAVLGDRRWSDVDLIYANAVLTAWLAGQVRLAGAPRLLSINTALRNHVALGRLGGRTVGPAGRGPRPSEAMQRALEREAMLDPLAATQPDGQAYIDECQAAGVPIPPAWNTSGWKSRGILVKEFIQAFKEAEVFVSESDDPPGVCIALPRTFEGRVGPVGIICQGNDSSKACFWDRAEVATTDPIPIAEFLGGGSGLDVADICTDCHAGRNAFVIHPGTPLDLGPILSPDAWYEPLVPEDWPQNRGPSTELGEVALGDGDGSCVSCHDLPTVSELDTYCRSVLNPAVVGIPTMVPPQEPTMPPENPDNLDFTKHVKALEAACGVPLPLPEPPAPAGPSVDEMFRIITMPLE